MINDDIIFIEQSLQISLPEEYRKILLSYPFANPDEICLKRILNNTDDIIRINLKIRAEGFKGHSIGKNIFILGSDEFENGFDITFIDLRESEVAVYSTDIENKDYNLKRIDKLKCRIRLDKFIRVEQYFLNRRRNKNQ